MNSRRNFITQALMTAGSIGGASLASHTTAFPQDLFAADASKQDPPTRFIFLHKGNGLFPSSLVPPSFTDQQMEDEKQKSAFLSLIHI